MEVEKFEDLIAWQKARVLTREIYIITRQQPFCDDFGLTRQMQRCVISIMSNLAEGFERGSRAEFRQYVIISKASCAELRSQLYAALDIGYITKEVFDKTNTLAQEVSRILGDLKASLSKARHTQNTKK